MKYIVPQVFSDRISLNASNVENQVRDFINKNSNLSIIGVANGPISSISFDSLEDFISGWHRLHRGENSVHIGSGRKSIHLMIFRS